MYGAVIGDVIGSVYEWNNIKTKEFPLFSKECSFTDDTILTIAAADWCMNGGAADDALRFWGEKYILSSTENKYGKAWFGKGFMNWINNPDMGSYQAHTNGAVMRLSPIPFLIRDTPKAIDKAFEFTNITHDHPESLKAVEAYIHVMHKIFKNENPEQIKDFIENKFGYNMHQSLEEIRNSYGKFDYTCAKTVPEAMTIALNASSFEDTIRSTISVGGDSDTLAAMSGALAEARFGIPRNIGTKTLQFLDKDVKNILHQQYTYPIEYPRAVKKEHVR